MKIELLKMRLENFMCYAQKEIDFFDFTQICAKNGVGKSTIATAYMWCLFNCDYELKDNPVVRREIDGLSVDHMDVSVELVLSVDGKEITAKKVQKRTYSKDGSSYKDDNKYFINDVPKTLKDFNAYLGIDMNVFKMCSNINAFLNKKPAEMREYLFSLIGDVTDLDIARSNGDLSELVPLLEKYSTEELSAMNKATKAKIAKDLPILDGQIKEKERDIQIKQSIDVSELELLKNSYINGIGDCIAKQTDNEALLADRNKASEDILELKFKLNDMVRGANDANVKAIRELEDKIYNKNALLDDARETINETNRSINVANQIITAFKADIARARDEWNSANNLVFDETSAVCPMCGREYPDEKRNALLSEFENRKAETLDAITKRGNYAKEHLKEEEANLQVLNAELQEHKESFNALRDAIDCLKEKLATIPRGIKTSDIPGYVELETEIEEKEQSMRNADDVSNLIKELKEKESDLRKRLAECEREISKTDTSKDEERLAYLKKSRMGSEQQKADAEKILDLLDSLDKAKNEALTDAVNSHFSLVKWRLFEYAKNGNYKSVCIPELNNMSILSTMSNKGNRILGKADICNSIQNISGISVPVFLDDSESLDVENKIKVADMMDCQLIMLIVTDNSTLQILEG